MSGSTHTVFYCCSFGWPLDVFDRRTIEEFEELRPVFDATNSPSTNLGVAVGIVGIANRERDARVPHDVACLTNGGSASRTPIRSPSMIAQTGTTSGSHQA